jgi:hypothetical protein
VVRSGIRASDGVRSPLRWLQRPQTDCPVGPGLVHLGDLPHEHPHGVPQRDPVQRPQVGVENENVHRTLLSESWPVLMMEWLPGLEPGTSTLATSRSTR